VPCAQGDLGIVIRERKPRRSMENLLHFTPQQVNEHLSHCIESVRKAIAERGGAR